MDLNAAIFFLHLWAIAAVERKSCHIPRYIEIQQELGVGQKGNKMCGAGRRSEHKGEMSKDLGFRV